jgi:membrane-associated protease RseP (regulator of RpoE activity)
MRNPAAPLALLVPLMLLSTASRLSAGGETGQPQEKKKIVVASPEKQIVVDGDKVMVWGDDDREFPGLDVLADLPDFADDFPRIVRFHGHRRGAYLGVRSIQMTPELRQHFGAPKDAGVLVGTVEPESPAAKAGIQVGDILTAVDGEEVGSTHALSRSVRRHKDGETVKIDLLRDRAKKTLVVTVAERKGDDQEMRIGEFGLGMRGFALEDRDFDGPAIAPVPPVPPRPPVPPAAPDAPRWNGLKDRVDSLEQRLKDVESRLPPR